MESQGGGLRMDIVAKDARPVEAKLGFRLVAEFEAGGQKRIMADVLDDGELRAGNMSNEIFCAGLDGNDRIGRACHDLDRDGNLRERIRRESWSKSRGNGENGADTRIAMRLGAFQKSGLKCRIRFGERAEFGG